MNLTSRIVIKPDDTTSVMAALADMQHRLTRLLSEVRIGVDSVATASNQIAAGNAHLSNRTEQQASGLQQTARTMQQMTDAVRANAASARQASQMVVSASEVAQAGQMVVSASEFAQAGGKVVAHVVITMTDIQNSGQKISEIVGTIDGIAFQANIFTLNAAVEAARAAKAGRGFAVVAAAVSTLAQRCAALPPRVGSTHSSPNACKL